MKGKSHRQTGCLLKIEAGQKHTPERKGMDVEFSLTVLIGSYIC